MSNLLYKVTAPRADRIFYPSRFWHTPDWESSTDKPREGYVEDHVLYVGDFDEVNIHLLPRTRTVRVRAEDASYQQLIACGAEVESGKTAYLFVTEDSRAEIEAFTPTIYTFEQAGFRNIRKGEYVSTVKQSAISSETLTMDEVIRAWNIQICYLEDLNTMIERLERANIYFDVQT